MECECLANLYVTVEQKLLNLMKKKIRWDSIFSPFVKFAVEMLTDLLAYFVLAQWSPAVSQSIILELLEIGLFMITTVSRHE
jgi:hypothetical protein